MPSISCHCPQCHRYTSLEVDTPEVLQCPLCSKEWGKMEEFEKIFDACPICQCRQFYKQKDFNQTLGCMIMLVGIVLVPFTYGLSLPVFAFADWLMYRRIPTMVVCYRCQSEFRGFPVPGRLKPFLHHIGEKYDQ